MRVLVAVLLFSVGLSAAAQSRGQVEGRVTASATGLAIPGATVWVAAQSRGTAADALKQLRDTPQQSPTGLRLVTDDQESRTRP